MDILFLVGDGYEYMTEAVLVNLHVAKALGNLIYQGTGKIAE